MKNIMLAIGFTALVIIGLIIHLLCARPDDRHPLVLSCRAEVQFDIQLPGSTTLMNGSLSLTTLGRERLALHYSGQLIANQQHTTLSRTLIMNYRYHPENHALELEYIRSHVSDVDTTPDDVFYRALLKKDAFIVTLRQIANNARLISLPGSPLYICIDQ